MSDHWLVPRLARDRPRPELHFTANDGWINDPYGVAFVDGRYHLYYQAIPGQVTWAPHCHWGHAQSEDLVHWEEQPLALIPQHFEVGCWSGSVVHARGRQLIFYTRVVGEEWQIGQVATAAVAADGTWQSAAEDVVIAGPPDDLAVTCFRDPFVFAHDGGWVMLIAAGLADETAAVLQYRSTDLADWVYDGVLCSRRSNAAHEVWTGSVWECPQLFQLEDTWVLLVSVLDDNVLQHVAAAVGDYDGRRFTPQLWQRLTYGASAYATSAFIDADGRRCLLSWLREEPQHSEALQDRSGAHSVVATAGLTQDGSLVLAPHPHLDALRHTAPDQPPPSDGTPQPIGERPVELTITAVEALTVELGEPGHQRAAFRIEGRSLVVDRPGLVPASQPVNPSSAVRILLDADIVEIFTETSYGAFRIAPAHDARRTSLAVTDPARSTALVRPFRTRLATSGPASHDLQ